MPDLEITIIGAGVVGLAIAARLSKKHPDLVVLEKNQKYGLETSSRNSEVVHAGIYYKPDSLKARLCVEGRDELYALAKRSDIPCRQITKLITATTPEELQKLEIIYRNGLRNGVPLEMLDAKKTLSMEPNIRSVGSIFSPLSGVISAHALMDYYYHSTITNGAAVQHRCEAVGIGRSNKGYTLIVEENGRRSEFTTEKVVNAAGLSSDRVAEMAGVDVDRSGYRQVYAKGSYFAVVSSKSKLVSRLVYPVPMNEGMGVHALIDGGGRLKFGPDVEYLPGRHIDYAVAETKRALFAEAIRRIVPAITEEDLTPDMSGIRPKLQRKGEAPKDFVIAEEKEKGLEGFVNLIGIESPGLTAAPAIARYVESLVD